MELTLEATGEIGAIALDQIEGGRIQSGDWVDDVAGTAWAMQRAGLATRGFRGRLSSDLPIGAGLSAPPSRGTGSGSSRSAPRHWWPWQEGGDRP